MIVLAVIGLLAACAPLLIRQIRDDRRRELLASQLRQSLQNMVHALRVGVGFNQALDYAAKEGAQPLAAEWRRVLQAVRLGQPLAGALEEMIPRVPIKEIQWFVTAVQITQSTGGSLAEVLETLSETLQEQQTLREKVSALTAQGKASGILLGLLPFLMMIALYIVDPKLTAPLFQTTIGQAVIAGVIMSVAVGGIVIKKIVTIQVD